LVRVALERVKLLTGLRVPQLDRLVEAPRCDGLAVAADGDRVDVFRVALEQGNRRLARLHVPQLDAVVCTGRGQRLAVGAERHAMYVELVALQGGQLL